MSHHSHGNVKPKKRYFLKLRRLIGFDQRLMNLKRWWKQKVRKTIAKGLGLESDDLVTHTNLVAYNLLYEMAALIESKRKLLIPHIATIEETVEELLQTEKSFSRFGDGEFGMMFSDFQLGFQRHDERLLQRLKEVLASQEPNLMIGLINCFGTLGSHPGKLREWIGRFRDQINPYLDTEKQYFDASVTRHSSKEHFLKLKQIWEGKKVVTIEGSMCRLGIGNNLFDNVGSLHRILAPAECAFSAYDRIVAEALKRDKDTLFLIALGPTATVLAYDLCKAGYRAIDIGHLDICYELFLRGTSTMVAIEGKYVGEASYRNPAPCTDPTYLSQTIVAIE